MIKGIKGFTLIELVTVIIILAVIGVIIAPKFSNDGFKESADLTNFLVNIKFVRGKSMVEGGGWNIQINLASKNYGIYNNQGSLAELPNGSKNPVKVNQSISYISSDTLTDNKIYFNNLGQPTLSDNHSDLIKHKITINIDGRNVFIEPYSGGIYE